MTDPADASPSGGTTSPTPSDTSRVNERAHLLPEEIAAGSDDPRGQAEAILADSDEREDDPEGTRHDSAQTPG